MYMNLYIHISHFTKYINLHIPMNNTMYNYSIIQYNTVQYSIIYLATSRYI